jgi:hypothetical protein
MRQDDFRLLLRDLERRITPGQNQCLLTAMSLHVAAFIGLMAKLFQNMVCTFLARRAVPRHSLRDLS